MVRWCHSNFTKLALTSCFLLGLRAADFWNTRDIKLVGEGALVIHILDQFRLQSGQGEHRI